MVEIPDHALASRAHVQLGDGVYQCWWETHYRDGPQLKCGRCGRGNLVAKKGQECGVCHAKVVRV